MREIPLNEAQSVGSMVEQMDVVRALVLGRSLLGFKTAPSARRRRLDDTVLSE